MTTISFKLKLKKDKYAVKNETLAAFARYLKNKSTNTICTVCGKDCKKASKLIVHMRTHTGSKFYACLHRYMSIDT